MTRNEIVAWSAGFFQQRRGRKYGRARKPADLVALDWRDYHTLREMKNSDPVVLNLDTWFDDPQLKIVL